MKHINKQQAYCIQTNAEIYAYNIVQTNFRTETRIGYYSVIKSINKKLRLKLGNNGTPPGIEPKTGFGFLWLYE